MIAESKKAVNHLLQRNWSSELLLIVGCFCDLTLISNSEKQNLRPNQGSSKNNYLFSDILCLSNISQPIKFSNMMKYKHLPERVRRKPLFLLVAGLTWVSLAQGQESINASGGDASGSGGKVAYSIGQAVYTTNTGSTGSVAQGVQHAYEIVTVGIRNTESNIFLTAFPNPTTDQLTLRIDDYGNERLSYQLYDMEGKLLYDAEIASQQTQIDMSNLPKASYLLTIVNQPDQKVQSFRIVKN